jgi:hypothetical protein
VRAVSRFSTPDIFVDSLVWQLHKACTGQVRIWWSSFRYPIDHKMSDPKPTMRWNIVSKAENGLYYLEFVEFESGCSGSIVFQQIQQLCLPRRNALGNRVSSLLYSPVVYSTTVIKARELYCLMTHDLTFDRDATQPLARMSKPALPFVKSS